MSKAKPTGNSPEGQCACPELCPLNQIEAGCSVKIKRLEAYPELSHRLREMGFCENQQVKMLRSDESVICQICNVRLGLSSELAGRILVEQVPQRKKAA